MRKLRSENGGLVVWLMGMLPILVMFLALLVNLILLVDAKIRMQAAIDRGVYAGASYLSHVMNEVARRNWQFRKEYLDKEHLFDKASEEKYSVLKKHIDELNHNQGKLYGEMDGMLSEGYAIAHEIAAGLVAENLKNMPHLAVNNYTPLYDAEPMKMFEMINDCVDGGECINKRVLSPVEIVGNAYDPEKYEPHDFEVYKYLIKDGGSFVALAGAVSTSFKPPLLPAFFRVPSGGVILDAGAAAQPYGGSIKGFSFVEAGDVDSAESLGGGLLYHPAFIPLKAVVGGTNVEH